MWFRQLSNLDRLCTVQHQYHIDLDPCPCIHPRNPSLKGRRELRRSKSLESYSTRDLPWQTTFHRFWTLVQSINQSKIHLLIRRITRLTQTQPGFTDELGVWKIRMTNENVNLKIAMSVVPCIKRVTVVLTGGFLVSHRWNAKQSSYRPF